MSSEIPWCYSRPLPSKWSYLVISASFLVNSYVVCDHNFRFHRFQRFVHHIREESGRQIRLTTYQQAIKSSSKIIGDEDEKLRFLGHEGIGQINSRVLVSWLAAIMKNDHFARNFSVIRWYSVFSELKNDAWNLAEHQRVTRASLLH